MNTILHSPAVAWGRRAGNPGFTSVPELDALLDAAATAGSAEAQAGMVFDAVRFAVSRRPIVRLAFLNVSWGFRPGLAVEAWGDDLTLAAGGRAEAS